MYFFRYLSTIWAYGETAITSRSPIIPKLQQCSVCLPILDVFYLSFSCFFSYSLKSYDGENSRANSKKQAWRFAQQLQQIVQMLAGNWYLWDSWNNRKRVSSLRSSVYRDLWKFDYFYLMQKNQSANFSTIFTACLKQFPAFQMAFIFPYPGCRTLSICPGEYSCSVSSYRGSTWFVLFSFIDFNI